MVSHRYDSSREAAEWSERWHWEASFLVVSTVIDLTRDNLRF